MLALQNKKKLLVSKRGETTKMDMIMRRLAMLERKNKKLQAEVDFLKKSKVDKLESDVAVKQEDFC